MVFAKASDYTGESLPPVSLHCQCDRPEEESMYTVHMRGPEMTLICAHCGKPAKFFRGVPMKT